MNLSIGDKVKIKNHPDSVTGKIVRRVANSNIWGATLDYKYIVEFDNKTLIPAQMEYDEDGLISLETKFSFGKKCECGGDRTYGEDASNLYHSRWCDKGKG